jgi:hypothetical protein
MDATSLVTGKHANALAFEASSLDRVNLPDADAGPLDANFTECTWAGWLMPEDATPDAQYVEHFISGKMGGSGDRGWQITLASDSPNWGLAAGDLVLTVFDAPDGSAYEKVIHDADGPVLSEADFTHVAIVFKADEYVRVYRDGALLFEDTSADVPSQWTAGNTVGFQVGNRGSQATYSFAGAIDDVYFFDTALSAQEIAQLMGPQLTPGDANGDGAVDDKDASILGAHWLASGAIWGDGDFNKDGFVNDKDAAILAAHWGQGESSADPSVPEPAALILLLAAALTLCLFRRKQGSANQ